MRYEMKYPAGSFFFMSESYRCWPRVLRTDDRDGRERVKYVQCTIQARGMDGVVMRVEG